MVFWAGGEMDCSKYDSILQTWADAGYFATCVVLFEDAQAAGDEPYFKEAARVDLTLRAVTDVGRRVWNGNDLMLSGISHGATAPVIAMARTAIDAAPAWKGAHKTAACFFDGLYDPAATEVYRATGDDGAACTLPVPHRRSVGRYYADPPAEHACDNGQCPCAPGHSPDIDQDTLTGRGLDVADFAVKHWKLIECGSALEPCAEDVLPKGPIEALCGAIDASPAHDCVLDPMPQASHGACSGPPGSRRCIEWFETVAAD